MRETVFLNIRKRNDSYMSAKPLVLRGVERYFQQSGCFLINIINLNSWVFSENHKTIYIIRIYFWKLICQGGITLKLYIFLFRVCKPMIFTVPLKLNNNYL